MAEDTKKSSVFQVICPCCQSVLWVDGVLGEVVKTEKRAAQKKGTLEDLLAREKRRQKEFGRKFEATAELERQKKEKAKQAFEKALGRIGEED